MSNFPEDRPKDRGIVKLSSALQQAPFTIVIAPISIICGVVGIAAAVLMPFWQSIIIIALLHLVIIVALWHRFPVTQRFPPIASRISLSLMIPLLFTVFLSTTLRNKYLKEYPPPSVVYVVPGVWSPAIPGRWIMIIRHCGSEPLYNVGIGFTDTDRSARLTAYGKLHGSITSEQIAQTYTSLPPFPEIDPTQQGTMFFWTPLDPDDENYSVRVMSREATFDETLKIVRKSEKWLYSIKVSDITTGKSRTIINCRDTGFPGSGERYHPVCFPHYVSEAHQSTCR
jgi:hypothetical protein